MIPAQAATIFAVRRHRRLATFITRLNDRRTAAQVAPAAQRPDSFRGIRNERRRFGLDRAPQPFDPVVAPEFLAPINEERDAEDPIPAGESDFGEDAPVIRAVGGGPPGTLNGP